ncbi:MAG: right-handed parallel beta-helix repeat-containing protein, partial [Solirubrobacteraceae bacterium]
MRRVLVLVVGIVALCVGASSALAHPERSTQYPDASKGAVPKYRQGGPARVVCKTSSRARINRIYKGNSRRTLRRKRLRQLRECKYRHIQAAVDAAKSGDRILIMPGVYREEPSRAKRID